MQPTLIELRNEVIQVLRDAIKRPAVLSEETNIVRDLGLDSLAVMNLSMVLEEKFDISIPLDRVAEVETVGDLVRTIKELQNGASA